MTYFFKWKLNERDTSSFWRLLWCWDEICHGISPWQRNIWLSGVSLFSDLDFFEDNKVTQEQKCQLSSVLSILLLQYSFGPQGHRGVLLSPWLSWRSLQPTGSYCDWISDCLWWAGYSWRWTLHYGNLTSNARQKDERKSKRKEEDLPPHTLSSAVCPSGVGLEGTAIETCTSCTHNEWPGFRMGCHDKDAGTRCYADTSFSGHVCTLFHCLDLLGWCSK